MPQKVESVSDEIKAKALEVLKKVCSECLVERTFEQAVARGHGFNNVNHRLYLVPTIIINRTIGCADFYTDPLYTRAFREMGAKRSTRWCWKDDGQTEKRHIGVWVVNYEVIGK